MSRLIKNKLNYLLTHCPVGIVLTSHFLAKKGYYKQLIKSYCDNNWLVPVGRGAYTRLNDKLTWQGAVYALQEQLELPMHVGGISALNIHRISQYVAVNESRDILYLYNTTFQRIYLPEWFKRAFPHCRIEHKKLFDGTVGISKTLVGDNIFALVSVPERAILEVLSLVPNVISLSYVNDLIEILHGLRYHVLQDLLENCFSVKVKRLFLCLAEKNNLPCLHELNIGKINLGSGKRVIGKGGQYYAKWQLSLPEMDDLWSEDIDEEK